MICWDVVRYTGSKFGMKVFKGKNNEFRPEACSEELLEELRECLIYVYGFGSGSLKTHRR